jgi:hypothetical protein
LLTTVALFDLSALVCSKPEPYVKKSTDHPRFGGKQIGVQWPKPGRTVDTYFQKEHPWVYNGCKFNDRLMYASQQQKPNRGFMTSDYHRRCAACVCVARCAPRCVYSTGQDTSSARLFLHKLDKVVKSSADKVHPHLWTVVILPSASASIWSRHQGSAPLPMDHLK